MPDSRPQPAAAKQTTDRSSDDADLIAELNEAVAARDTFIAVAAHELRNPMTPLVGHIDLLLATIRSGRCPPEQIERRLEHIQRLMGRYVKRAEILLDVSRLTQGRLQLELEPLDLAVLVRRVVDEFAGDAQRRGIPLAVTAPDSLPGIADGLALEQVVENLISNAIKYGGGTPVEIGLEARGPDALLRVRDHGDGIPEEARSRIFERFERAVGHGERRSGFGVGLWVVRQLVDAMNGRIVIEDAVGGGALFSVLLPLDAKERT